MLFRGILVCSWLESSLIHYVDNMRSIVMLTFQSYWSLDAPKSLIFKNTVYMCFGFIWKQTAIFAILNIN